MQIATWNVNSIRSRQDIVVDWLNQHPTLDVLCLQETKVIDQDFPREPFEALGYHLYISGQKSYNGVAMFSRTPLEDVSAGFAPIVGETLADEFEVQKRVITGVLNNVRIVNLYVPNGSAIGSEKYDYKLRWFKVLREYLKTLLEQSPGGICLCGDFNIALEDRDVHDPTDREKKIMASDLERETLQTFLDLGFQDAFRKFTSEGGHFSWWDYRTRAINRNRGWRIDHHYLTPQLYEQATSCTIDIKPRKLPKPSDHTPVIVEF